MGAHNSYLERWKEKQKEIDAQLVKSDSKEDKLRLAFRRYPCSRTWAKLQKYRYEIRNKSML